MRACGSDARRRGKLGELLRVGVSGAYGRFRASRPGRIRSAFRSQALRPTRRISAGCGLAIGAGRIWVLGDALMRTLWRIDPGTGRIEATARLPFAPRSVAVGAGAVWVTAQLDDFVARIDPGKDRILARIKVGREPSGVAVGDGSVWVADTIDRTVTRIDPRQPGRRDDPRRRESGHDRGRRGRRVGGRRRALSWGGDSRRPCWRGLRSRCSRRCGVRRCGPRHDHDRRLVLLSGRVRAVRRADGGGRRAAADRTRREAAGGKPSDGITDATVAGKRVRLLLGCVRYRRLTRTSPSLGGWSSRTGLGS